MRGLNAVSSSVLGELDYDTRVSAYDTIMPELFTELKVEHALLILSHCVYDMASDELIFRQSASRALRSFIHFAASVLNNSEISSTQMVLDDGSKEESTNQIVEKEDTESKWTKACVNQIINTTYLHNIGDSTAKDVSVQKVGKNIYIGLVYVYRVV